MEAESRIVVARGWDWQGKQGLGTVGHGDRKAVTKQWELMFCGTVGYCG